MHRDAKQRNTILIVEDEDVLLSLVRDVLETAGYQVLTAGDGLEAVNTFKTYAEDIDLVMTDLGMSKMSGIDAYFEIKWSRELK